jgi:hypothetical protein
MRTLKTAFLATALALVIMALPVSGKAANLNLNQKTVIAFTQPLEIPGMVLQPGAYVFKTSDINEAVVSVYDGSESHLLTTLMTIPSQRMDVSSSPVVLEERPAGNPQALRAWFSAGETSGREFVYSTATAAGQ